VKNAPAAVTFPYWLSLYGVRLGFIAVICSSSTILSDRELKSPIAAGSYCPIFVGSLHCTCTREHKNWQFERAGVRKLSAKLFKNVSNVFHDLKKFENLSILTNFSYDLFNRNMDYMHLLKIGKMCKNPRYSGDNWCQCTVGENVNYCPLGNFCEKSFFGKKWRFQQRIRSGGPTFGNQKFFLDQNNFIWPSFLSI
jgi:hypothetical protein